MIEALSNRRICASNPLPATYIVTGLGHSGKRVRVVTTSRLQAFGVHLWRGTIWIVINHSRIAVKRIKP